MITQTCLVLNVARVLMDPNVKASKGGETDKKKIGDQVVVVISGEDSKARNGVDSPQNVSAADSPQKELASRSPEIARFSPSPNKPPKIPTTGNLTQRKSLARSVYSKSKSKSRFGEQSVPLDSIMFEDQSSNSPLRNISNRASPNKETLRTVSNTPSVGVRGEDEDEDEEIYKKVTFVKKLKYERGKMKVLLEWMVFICIMGCLVASLTVHRLQHHVIRGLEIWKWCVLIMVTFCGLLVTNWFMKVLVFLIESNFLLRKKVLYFVHGLKKSVQVCIWLCVVLVTWILLFNHQRVNRSATANRILSFVTWTLVSLLIGSFLWLFKTLLLKILASSFHVNTFFDRIQDSIYHQYILKTLSGRPVREEGAQIVRETNSTSQLSFRITTKGKEGKGKTEVIDINKLHNMKQGKVSAWSWTMKKWVDVISTSGLSTISNSLDEESVDDGEGEQEITSEMEAIAAAYHIFNNVAHDSKYIEETDLKRFLIEEEVGIVFKLIAGAEIHQLVAGPGTRQVTEKAETPQIDRKALTEWVVKVYKGRKALAHALSDTKTAVKQLNKLVTGVLIVVMIILWLLLTEVATTKVLFLLSSQLVVAVFMFGNTCKTIFEAIIFVFVMHPFDVGDRCIIDGVQLVVEEMNILTTVFLKFDFEKIYYPNSVLATKAISNFYRSPDMGDSLEFSIDFMTPLEKIGALKDRIHKYLNSNSLYWHLNHNLIVKEIENVNKLRMVLFFNHTINFQDYMEKNKRRSELVVEMKKIFEELGIKYNLLPQEVHLIKSATPTGTTK
uniref:Mechanosensitive ion channel protein n=2 Tax=Davidia involucrata TaxID=16924 RepID=A0A5B7BXI8_DAVIN